MMRREVMLSVTGMVLANSIFIAVGDNKRWKAKLCCSFYGQKFTMLFLVWGSRSFMEKIVKRKIYIVSNAYNSIALYASFSSCVQVFSDKL